MKNRVVLSIATALILVLSPSSMEAQRTRAAEPAPPVDAGPLTEEEERMHADRPTPSVMRLGNVQTDAVTPAADISAGNFGANTGGGTYTFPGNVGWGTTAPGGFVHVANGAMIYETNLNSDAAFGFSYRKSRGTHAAKTTIASGDNLGFFGFNGFDGTAYRLSAIIRGQADGAPAGGAIPGRIIFGTPGEQMRLTSAGNLGIGTTNPTFKLHVVGNAHVTGAITGGTIAATYQDVAEWVPSAHDLNPGEVVVLDTTQNNQVTTAGSEYSTRVAGVVSEQPGLTLGIPGDDKEMIATTGRVRVKVDASKGPIAVGDLLVTSSRAGVAMKSVPMDINGRSFHQPGTIIGKALEPLASGEGMILVLLSLQ